MVQIMHHDMWKGSRGRRSQSEGLKGVKKKKEKEKKREEQRRKKDNAGMHWGGDEVWQVWNVL